MAVSKRRILILVIFAFLLLTQYLFFRSLISSGQLPNPLAIHWGLSGKPDGFSDPSGFLRGVTITYLLGLVLMAAVGFSVKRRLLRPLLFGFFGFFLVLLMAIFSSAMLVQVGRRAEDVTVSAWGWLLILILPLALVLALFTTPRVSLGKDLRVQLFGLTLLRLDFADLTGVSELELRAREFGGLGIRYAWRTLAFIPRAGKGVLLTTNFGESVAIRSNAPELLIPAIRARIEKS